MFFLYYFFVALKSPECRRLIAARDLIYAFHQHWNHNCFSWCCTLYPWCSLTAFSTRLKFAAAEGWGLISPEEKQLVSGAPPIHTSYGIVAELIYLFHLLLWGSRWEQPSCWNIFCENNKIIGALMSRWARDGSWSLSSGGCICRNISIPVIYFWN